MSIAEAPSENTEFVDFWNDVLVPKFTKYRHILVGGLSHHSAKILPSLKIGVGDKVVDVGCGFGDTAIQFAERVGATGSVLGVDCCDGFRMISASRASVRNFSKTRWPACAACARRSNPAA